MSDELIIEILNKDIKYIKENIDDKYKMDFNRNLASMNVYKTFSKNSMLSSISYFKNNTMLGIYAIDTNNLLLIEDNLDKIKRLYNDSNDIISSRLILHELFHMASSKANEYSGVNSENEFNTGLNEGITEILAFNAYPSSDLFTSGYLYELLLAVQLGAVVGMDKLYDAYFVDHNLDKVKQLLNMYLNDEDKTNDFFKDFEFAYSNRQKNNDLSMLGKLQSTLVYALKKKDVDNNYLNNFKKYIITPDLIIKREKEYKDIPLLQESIDLIEFMISKRDI